MNEEKALRLRITLVYAVLMLTMASRRLRRLSSM